MTYFDFDTAVDRRNTDSLKYDFAESRGRPADVLPLWVADMDFRAPDSARNALRNLADHGIFGYSDTREEYADAVLCWFERRHGWRGMADWIVKTPGVVTALALSVRAYTEPGDCVLIQPPVYYPFYQVIRDNGRRIAECPLVLRDGRYEIDLNRFEETVARQKPKMFLLCSPHNPVGRVWSEEELCGMGEICRRHNVLVVSDEIHCDIVRPGHRHRVFPEVVPDLTDRCVLCTAPSKTFNLAGLQISNIFIPDDLLRARFAKELSRFGYSQPNQAGIAVCQAVYRDPESARWLDALLSYLWDNLRFLKEFLAAELPGIRLIEGDGTYFAWLDCSDLGLTDPELNDLVTNRAKLWLDAGRMFGKEAGSGFQRLVYACPRSTLKEALARLKRAVES